VRRLLRLPAWALAVLLAFPALPQAAAGAAEGEPLVFAPHGLSEARFPEATTFQRVEVQAHDGVMLSSRVYRPDTSSDPDWRTPVILVHSPYYDSIESAVTGATQRSMDLVKRYTPKGYTVVLSSVRGTGDSGGCLEQDGPNQAKDFKTLVEYFAAQPWSNGKVASYGKSYDAETQNAGAVLDPEGLETMITVAGISSLYDVAYFDGVPLNLNGLLSAAVYVPDGEGVPTQPAAAVRVAERQGCQPDNFAYAADMSGDETTYWAERNFRYNIDNIDASVLYVHGLSDFTVSPIAIDGWYDELPTFKRAILGQWAHFYPYDAPATVARNDWYDAVDAWLDHELLGLPTGIASWPPVQVQDETNVWRAVDSFRAMGVERALPLGANGELGSAGGAGATAAYAERTPVSWTGPVLEAPLHLSGQAFLDATIALDRPDGHLAVTLQEVRPDATVRTLTRGYLSVQHQEDPNRGHPVTPGYPVPYRIRTYPFDRTLGAGSRLRVTMAGSDGSTLPAGNGYAGTVSVDGRSVLRLPVVEEECGLLVAQRTPPKRQVPGCASGIPTAAPRFVPDASRGHVATHRFIATRRETIGGVEAVRESGYLTVRDGTELAFEVVRPAAEGQYPTLLTYDGYAAGTSPDPGYAARYLPKGYALVGLSVRGTGCSGGEFDFFQPSEGPDGFEMVEWIARQAWSTGSVGMVGKSYPGITQLFVAETRPPHLSAVAPGHYYADAYRDVAFPGGILNYAFAALWSFIAQPGPGVQATPGEVFAGDQTCARHLDKHPRNLRMNPFLQAQEHPFDDPLIQNRSPLSDLGRIDVPVYTALAWQDEQLASRQVHSLDRFEEEGIAYRAVLSNGDHNMYRRAPQLEQLDRFFEAHVERRQVLRDGTAREDYLNEPPITVLWEQSGSAPRWATTLEEWGPQATPWRLFMGEGERLVGERPTTSNTSDSYAHTAAGSQGVANPAYASGSFPNNYLWDEVVPPRGAALSYTTAPLAEDTTLLGSASADLWITASAPNVDLQVTLTEIRPDGQEVYVQQGWLRTKQRALDPDGTTELRPAQTHRIEDVQPLSGTAPQLARVEIFPFGHVFRQGSRIRLWIEAPTVLPQLWGFELDPTPAQVQVWRDKDFSSSLVLPLAGSDSVPPQPTCGEPLRQPCRVDPRPA
jgi:putative CocE/NonD family hydrolase